jgi:transglutaminase-like putative cysteine protease
MDCMKRQRYRHTLPLLAALMLLGCAPAPVAVPPSQSTTTGAPSAATTPPRPETWGPTVAETGGSWDAIYMAGARVGFSHMWQTTERVDGQPLVCVGVEHQIRAQRFGQVTDDRLLTMNWEHADGRLVRFESVEKMGSQPTQVRGRVERGQLVIVSESAGQVRRHAVSWPAEGGGAAAIELSLRRQPMQPGERRRVVALIPILNLPAPTDLTAVGEEETALLGQTRRLLRIDAVTTLGQTKIAGTLWADPQGEMLKQVIRDPIEQTIYRTAVFPTDSRQHVQRVDAHTATITIYSRELALQPENRLDEPGPTAADSQPSALLQSGDPAVMAMALRGASRSGRPAVMANAYELLVYREIKKKNFSQALSSAAEVARSLEGDCTEHAMLLAALLRAASIPARVAIGLVYVPSEQGMVFHMWTEAYFDGRWVELDATRDNTRGFDTVGPGHLKLAHSRLADGEGLLGFLTVARVLGKVAIDVVSVDGP